MKTLIEYIKEKLVINKDSKTLFDALMKALIYAKKEYNSSHEEQYIYKTKNNEYGVCINDKRYKVSDTTEEGFTVVELVGGKK